jgi:hypothetical protein
MRENAAPNPNISYLCRKPSMVGRRCRAALNQGEAAASPYQTIPLSLNFFFF